MLDQALQAHIHADQLINNIQATALVVTALAVIVTALAQVYVMLLLRGQLRDTARGLSHVLASQAEIQARLERKKARIEALELRLGMQ